MARITNDRPRVDDDEAALSSPTIRFRGVTLTLVTVATGTTGAEHGVDALNDGYRAAIFAGGGLSVLGSALAALALLDRRRSRAPQSLDTAEVAA